MDEKRIGLLAAAGILAVNGAFFEWKADNALARETALIASFLNDAPADAVGREPGESFEARVEDDTTLVLAWGNLPDGDGDIDAKKHGELFVNVICSSQRFSEFVEEGANVRLVFTERGSADTFTMEIDDCP